MTAALLVEQPTVLAARVATADVGSLPSAVDDLPDPTRTGRRPGTKSEQVIGPPIQRLMSHIEMKSGPLNTPCWHCTYLVRRDGYPRIQVAGHAVLPHRVSYEHYVGMIPTGLFVDHLCRNRTCVNPQHLEVVTGRENMLRGMSPAAVSHRTNVCKHGHSLDDAYVNYGRYGHLVRRCRTCSKLRDQRRGKAA